MCYTSLHFLVTEISIISFPPSLPPSPVPYLLIALPLFPPPSGAETSTCPDWDLCVDCFGAGVELGKHKNDHVR